MKKDLRLIFSVCFLALGLSACEGPFAGSRAADTLNLHGPSTVKIFQLGGHPFLALVNTAADGNSSVGSLQFYALDGAGTPTTPYLMKSMTLTLPTNVGGIWLDIDTNNSSRLFVVDRNLNQVLVYDYNVTSQVFQTVNPPGQFNNSIGVCSNPDQIIGFLPTGASERIIVVLCKNTSQGGALQFIRRDHLQLLPLLPTDPIYIGDDLGSLNSAKSARFYMEPHQEGGVFVPIAIDSGSQVGYGLTGLVYAGHESMPVTDFSQLPYVTTPIDTDILVTSAGISNAIFGYRYRNGDGDPSPVFENSINYAWDLSPYRDGFQNTPGSNEFGFRGLAADPAGNIYAVNRTDNSLYHLNRTSHFTSEKEIFPEGSLILRNTWGFQPGVERYAVNLVFDTNTSDTVFPRLGNIILDCSFEMLGTCNQASQAWILGVGTGVVYRVDLNTSTLTASNPSNGIVSFGTKPQNLAYYKKVGGAAPSSYLYITSSIDNVVTILDAASLATLASFTKPTGS